MTDRRSLETWVMALLAGVMNTRAASPKSLLREEVVQLVERIQRDARRTQFHGRAVRWAEHPCGNDDDDSRTDFYVNDLAVGALLAVVPPDATPIEWMPAIEDFNFLPDMGRMTRRLLWAGEPGCSPVANWLVNVLQS